MLRCFIPLLVLSLADCRCAVEMNPNQQARGACLDVLAEVALTLDDVAIGSTTVVTTSTPLKRPISTIDVVEVQRVPKITVTRHRASGSDSIKKIRVVPREGHLSHAFHQTVACEEEYGEMVEKLAASKVPPRTTSELIAKVLPPEVASALQNGAASYNLSIDTMGLRKRKVSELGRVGLGFFKKVAVAVLGSCARVLKAGNHKDVEGVLQVTMQAISEQHQRTHGKDLLQHPVVEAIKKGVVRNTQMGERKQATQLLSLVTSEMENLEVVYGDVEDSFTHLEPLKEGDQVRALLGESADGKRRPHTHGCEVIRVEETGEVTMRVPTQVDPEDGDDIAAVANTHEETVKREDVTHNLDVRVNKYTIQQVVNHGKATFPGAPVVSVPRELERLPPDVRHSFESSVSDGKHLNISDASVKRKTNVKRTKGRAELHELHKEAAEAKGIKPVGRTYWYDHQPVDVGEPCDEKECGCDTCHHCGEESWRFLNDLASTVRSKCGEIEGLPEVIVYVKAQINLSLETTLRGHFEHTALESRTGTHCRCFALSNPHTPKLATPCDPAHHLLHDGTKPVTLQAHSGPDGPDDDWETECTECGKRGTPCNELMMCITCVHVKHNKGPTCLLGKLKLPLSVEEDYQCLDCVCTQDGLLHVNDCSKCNAIPNLFGTIRRLLEFISTTDHEFKGEPGRWWLARLDRIESDVNTRLLPHLKPTPAPASPARRLSPTDALQEVYYREDQKKDKENQLHKQRLLD